MLDLVCPQKLSPGDTICMVAPSEPIERENVEKTKKYLESLGYKLKLGKHLFYKIGDYTAGTIEDRAEDLNAAFADPEVKAIFMGRGGYAGDQVLDLLDYNLIQKNPKIFLGFSDGTTLELAFLAKTGLISFSGPNGAELYHAPEYTLSQLWQTLTGQQTSVTPHSKWEVLRNGKGKGLLLGGNLDIVSSLLGTQYDPFPLLKDKKIILFWEEFDSQYNYIIRNLFHLKHAGIFESCEGMVVGKIVDCSEEGGYVGVPELRYILLQMARAYDFPIIWNADFGHLPEKATIPVGVEAEIDTKSLMISYKNCLS